MNIQVTLRAAEKADLLEILRLYAQPALDDGRVLSITEAERIFDRMVSYNGWLHDFRANSHGFGLMIRGAVCVTVNSQAGLLTTRSRADPRYG